MKLNQVLIFKEHEGNKRSSWFYKQSSIFKEHEGNIINHHQCDINWRKTVGNNSSPEPQVFHLALFGVQPNYSYNYRGEKLMHFPFIDSKFCLATMIKKEWNLDYLDIDSPDFTWSCAHHNLKLFPCNCFESIPERAWWFAVGVEQNDSWVLISQSSD